MLPQGAKLNGYEVVSEIGKGEFGKVMLAKNNKGMRFAIKTILLPNLAHNPTLQSFLAQETSILLRLNHPNIVEFFEEFQHENLLCIVYEFCDHGNLGKLIQREGRLNEMHGIYICREVLLALEELERCQIIHRDIKPENILLKDSKVKLADFGLSAYSHLKHTRLVGSPMFMAPESIHRFEYSTKSDIYAVGVTLVKLLTGKFPFLSDKLEGLLALKYNFYPDVLSQDLSWQARKLISSCLHPNSTERPSATQLISLIEELYPSLQVYQPVLPIDFKSPNRPTHFLQPRYHHISNNPSHNNPLQHKYGHTLTREDANNSQLNYSGHAPPKPSNSYQQSPNHSRAYAHRDNVSQMPSPLHRRHSNPFQPQPRNNGTQTPKSSKELDFSNCTYPRSEPSQPQPADQKVHPQPQQHTAAYPSYPLYSFPNSPISRPYNDSHSNVTNSPYF